MGIDLVSILEAAYEVERSEEEWLTGVVAAARPALDRGLGAYAYFYDVSDPAQFKAWCPVIQGGAVTKDVLMAAVHASPKSVSPAGVANMFRFAPAISTLTVSSGLGDKVLELPAMTGAVDQSGLRDFLGVVSVNPTGLGCFFGAPLPAPWAVPGSQVAVWTRIVAHIAAGLRLRGSVAKPDAILSPTGRIEHAEAPAKDAGARGSLARAATRVDKARSKMRRTDPEEALSLWRGLVGGRWSLVDHVDSDGRRYLFARRNDPDTLPWRKLTVRERQTVGYAAMGHANKIIGYELGLSTSTIAAHLSSAAKKLGLRSRVALIQAYRKACA